MLPKLWLWGTLLTILLRVLLSPPTVERYYSRGLYPAVRVALDATLTRLPFPLFYLFWLLLLLAMSYGIARVVRRGWSWRALIYGITRLLCLLLVLFMWLWGFNYGRLPVEESLNFTRYQPTMDELRQEVLTSAERMATYRRAVSQDTQALGAGHFPPDLEQTLRPLLADALQRHGYPAPGSPRGRELIPRGILLRLGTAGVYWPWAAEGNIDAGLHPLQKPAVLAHELAHAYGFGDEGTCSFWARLAAAETDDALLKYSLELAYWRQLAGLLRYADPETYLTWREAELDAGIRNDLTAIYANGELYQDLAPALRDATYSTYLRAQGIHDGLLNYGRVVELVEGYRRSAWVTPPSR